jgi:hypothetical protein
MANFPPHRFRARLERFAINTRGRDLAVGDIHGCFSALQRGIDELGFDVEQLSRLPLVIEVDTPAGLVGIVHT